MVILMDSYESMKDEPYETDLLKLFIRNGFGIIYIITEKWMIFFFAVISSPEAAKKAPAKIAEKLYNSDWFFDALGKVMASV